MPKGVYRRHPKPQKRRHPRTKPDHRGKIVLAKGRGSVSLFMASGTAARLMARRNKSVGANKGHRWTSEEARQAARTLWDKRWPVKGFAGHPRAVEGKGAIRVGYPRNKRSRTNRKALRAYYAEHPTNGITFINKGWIEDSYWQQTTTDLDTKYTVVERLSERTALTRLGHLKSQHGFVPVEILTHVVPGKRRSE